LFDANNRQELQNRVFQVVFSVFSTDSKGQLYGVRDYLALGLGFFFESMVFFFSLLYHSSFGSRSSLNLNKYGYKGRYFSSYDVCEICKNTDITIDDLVSLRNKVSRLSDNVFAIHQADGDMMLLEILKAKKLFKKVIYSVKFKDAFNDLKLYNPQYSEEEAVSLYISPEKNWSDFLISIEYLNDGCCNK